MADLNRTEGCEDHQTPDAEKPTQSEGRQSNDPETLQMNNVPQSSAVGIAGYSIVRELKRGGQATVFEAVQDSTGRTVAIKILHKGPLFSPQEKARFDREVRVLAALDHPNIVHVIDRGETLQGAMYLATDYVTGKSLDRWLEFYCAGRIGGPAPAYLSNLLQLFLKICDAVNAAHIRGIVHRDLKPSNIVVDDHGESHILDFGLAHMGVEELIPGEAPEAVTFSGQFFGSLPWASPEQAEGHHSKLDTRTDVYSLGVILCQMLTGKFPYDVSGSMRATLNNIITAQPSPPSQMITEADKKKVKKQRRLLRKHRAALDPLLDAIVMKALSKNRDNRYQTAGDLARDVANYLSGRPNVAAVHKSMADGLGKAAVFIFLAVLCAVGIYVFPGWWLWRRGDPNGVAQRRSPSQLNGIQQSVAEGAGNDSNTESTRAGTPMTAPGQPMGVYSLVQAPTPIEGLHSWTIETRMARECIVSIDFSPDGTLLAALDKGGVVRIHDVSNGELQEFFILPGLAEHADIRWSPHGTLLAASSTLSGRIVLMDPAHGKVLRKISAPNCRGLCWSPEGDRLAWTQNLVVKEYNLSENRTRLVGKAENPQLAWPSHSDEVIVADLNPILKRLGELSFQYEGGAATLSPDGRRFAIYGRRESRNGVFIVDSESAEIKRFLDISYGNVASVRWAPDGRTVALKNSVFDIATKTKVAEFALSCHQPFRKRDCEKFPLGRQDRGGICRWGGSEGS